MDADYSLLALGWLRALTTSDILAYSAETRPLFPSPLAVGFQLVRSPRRAPLCLQVLISDGWVFMLEKANWISALAFIIGHEVAHAVAKAFVSM